MVSTPATPDPLHNEPLEELKGQDVDKLITPDEIVFQQISDPEPSDSQAELDETPDEEAD
jgi:hypothetical protein